MAEAPHDLVVTDGGNTARWPENMPPSGVNDAGRGLEGLLARYTRDVGFAPAATLSGSSIKFTANRTSITLTGTTSNYVDGLVVSWKQGATTITGPAGLNINSIGKISLRDNQGASLSSSMILSGMFCLAVKDGTNDYFRLVLPQRDENTVSGITVLDEDDMASNDPSNPPSQQSTKAYVDAAVSGGIPAGTVVATVNSSAPSGWLLLNGDTIGSAASAATQASANYQTLFELFWNSMSNTHAPVSGGRGASASADWSANKTLTMPDARGRSLIGTGTGAGLTARTHGDDSGGSEDAIAVTHSHTAGTLATVADGSHQHTLSGATAASDGAHTHSLSTATAAAGGSHAHSLSSATAAAGGSHAHSLSTASAASDGAHDHSLSSATAASTGAHTHTFGSGVNPGTSQPPQAGDTGTGGGTTTTSSSGDHTHSVTGITTSHAGHTHSVTGVTTTVTTHTHSVTGVTTTVTTHTHNVTGVTNSQGAHTHGVSGGTVAQGSHTHAMSGSTASAGSSGTGANMSPWLALNYIVKW